MMSAALRQTGRTDDSRPEDSLETYATTIWFTGGLTRAYSHA